MSILKNLRVVKRDDAVSAEAVRRRSDGQPTDSLRLINPQKPSPADVRQKEITPAGSVLPIVETGEERRVARKAIDDSERAQKLDAIVTAYVACTTQPQRAPAGLIVPELEKAGLIDRVLDGNGFTIGCRPSAGVIAQKRAEAVRATKAAAPDLTAAFRNLIGGRCPDEPRAKAEPPSRLTSLLTRGR